MRKALATAIGTGMNTRRACALLNIDESTYYKWLERGRAAIDVDQAGDRDERPYVELVEAVAHAHAKIEQTALDAIQAAMAGGYVVKTRTLPSGIVEEDVAPPDWKAAAWLLERRLREDWRQDSAVLVDTGDAAREELGAMLADPEATRLMADLAYRLAQTRDPDAGP